MRMALDVPTHVKHEPSTPAAGTASQQLMHATTLKPDPVDNDFIDTAKVDSV